MARRRRRSAVDADTIQRLRVGFVVLVALSGTMMALQGGASLPVVALATGIGALAGGALLWYLTWIVS